MYHFFTDDGVKKIYKEYIKCTEINNYTKLEYTLNLFLKSYNYNKYKIIKNILGKIVKIKLYNGKTTITIDFQMECYRYKKENWKNLKSL